MSEYIEITSLPLSRITNETLAPAALLAARLAGSTESIELRIQIEKDCLHCYIGVNSILRASQLKMILADLGCGLKYVENHPFNTKGIVMLRKVYENYNRIPDQNLGRSLIINELSTTKNKLKSLFYSLSKMPNGCGYSLLIKPITQLDIQTTTFLKEMIEKNTAVTNSLYFKLFNAPYLFQSCICIWGNSQEELSLLQSELQYAFTGVQSFSDTPINITIPAIWKYLDSFNPPVSSCKSTAILSTFLFSEIQSCTSLDGLNEIPKGVAINRDSLFPKQRNLMFAGKRYISLGFNEEKIEQKIPLKILRQHMFIAGAPGTGKGNLIFSIAEQLYKLNVPVLLIESAKQEQHHLRKSIPDLRVWRPKGGEYLLNPFSLPPDITMGDYKSALLQMLRTCFKGGGSDSALDELYATTLNICLSKYGYTESSTNSSKGVLPFGLSEFIMEYIQLLEKNGYSDRARNDMRTAGVTRLRALFDQNPDVFDTVNSVPVSELANGYNLLQLNSLTTTEAKQLFSTILLISLGTWLRLNGRSSEELQLVIIMDESHNLLKGVKNNSDVTYSFAEDFQNLLLEMRSLGVSFIVADQSATNVPKIISEVCATKVFLGSSRFSGIDMYSQIFKADDQTLDNLYMLNAGEGIWNTYGMSSGAFFKSPNVIEKYHVNDSYIAKNPFTEQHSDFFCQTFSECKKCPSNSNCNLLSKQKARRLSGFLVSTRKVELETALKNIQIAFFSINSKEPNEHLSTDEIERKKKKATTDLVIILSQIARDIVNSPDNGNPFCCAIQFSRHFNREMSIPLNNAYINKLLEFVNQVIISAK